MKKTKPTKAAKAASKPAKTFAKAAPAKAKGAKAAASKAAPKAKASAKKPVKAVGKAPKAAKPAPKASKAKAPAKASPKTSLKASATAKASAAKATKSVTKVSAKAAKPVVAKATKAPAKETAPKETPVKAAKAPKKETAPKVDLKPVYIPEEPDVAEEVILTDAEGRRYCRTKDCDRLAEVDNYCRYHYILLWKNIQIRRNILQEGKLGRYIEELTARYPDKFLEILKKDLRSEKDFLAAIQELEIDESAVEAEFDDEESQSDIFEIQRVSEAGNSGDRSDSDDRF
jgi:hypothetical protein